MTDLRIAHRSAVVDLDGTPHRVRRGRTLAVAAHPIVRDHPELWRPLVVDYDVDPDQPPAAADPDPTGGDANDDEHESRPSAKAVRAWARENGVDVPARGRVPDEVVAAYEAAQEH